MGVVYSFDGCYNNGHPVHHADVQYTYYLMLNYFDIETSLVIHVYVKVWYTSLMDYIYLTGLGFSML